MTGKRINGNHEIQNCKAKIKAKVGSMEKDMYAMCFDKVVTTKVEREKRYM